MRFVVLLVAALYAACASPATYPRTSATGDPLVDVVSLGWMQGSWAATGDDWRWEEHWSTPAGGSMIGMSRMVRGGRTMFTEAARIEQRDGAIFFVVHPSNAAAGEYRLIENNGWQAEFHDPNATPHTLGYRLQPDGSLLSWTVTRRDGVDHKEFFPKLPTRLVVN